MSWKLTKHISVTIFFITVLSILSSASWAKERQSQQQDSTVPINRQTRAPSFFGDPAADPFEEMEKIQQSFNNILRESWRRMRNYQQAGMFFEPDADFVDQGRVYILKMDLPGMQKDKIQIEATENFISVSGERHTERQAASDPGGFYQFERSSGSFLRRMSLPSDANTEQIAAKYENGVLEITIPKNKPQTVEKKKIAVQ